MRTSAHEAVTERILAALEKGTVPWREPWTAGMRPRSMATGKPYRGINVMLLGLTEHTSPYWGTYKQIQAQGGNVRRGEKGTMVVLWKPVTGRGEDEEERQYLLSRTFYVFNADQADGLPAKFYPQAGQAHEALAEPQAVAEAYMATAEAAGVAHDAHGQAYYDMVADQVHVPALDEFKTAEGYYSTLFHELSHSTGHKTRLNRWEDSEDRRFGSHDYGREELAAQWSAALLDAETGISGQTEEMSASYLASWIAAIKADQKLIMAGAAAGQKAADLILAASAAKGQDETEEQDR